jgi:transketolase
MKTVEIIMYETIRKKLVEKILTVSSACQEGHIGSSLSVLDILYGIYSNMNMNDRFVLSKGHASLGLYMIMEHYDILQDDVFSFCKFESNLGGHPSSTSIPSISCSTGSLGHGFPFALGMAMSKKIKKEDGRVFCIIGDGEANEGTVWETALIAAHQKINNFCTILDQNHSSDRALNIGDILQKFKSFGWHCSEIDGHNLEEITKAISIENNKPQFILANTIKGKGCKIMENNPEWHHKFPNSEQLNSMIGDLYE